MKRLLIYGEKNDLRISHLLAKTISAKAGVEYISFEGLKPLGNQPSSYIVFDTDQTVFSEHSKTILIFKKQFDYSKKLHLQKDSIIIFEGSNSRAINYIGKSNCNTLCCGVHSKDTISLSANTDNRSCISIQREITTISGNIIEPMELAVNHLYPEEPYTLLATCAALLVCDIKPVCGEFSLLY